MADCKFTPVGVRKSSSLPYVCKCSVCGLEINAPNCNRVFAECGCRHGLGDRVERALKKIGVTKQGYGKILRKLGIKNPCGCKKRQEALNRLGHKLGI